MAQPSAALGAEPSEVVEISGSDGEPDLSVSFTADDQDYTARSMPRTVQDVVSRIREISGSSASASLSAGRLDVSVGLDEASQAEQLKIGNPSTLGALVGLTGLRSPDPANPATARAVATGSHFDVGFGIETGTPPDGAGRKTYLLPGTGPLLSVGDVSATPPSTVTDLPARIGFLGVNADLTGLSLGKTDSDPAVELDRVAGSGTAADSPLDISDLLTKDGALDPDQLHLTSRVTASIAFRAREQALSGSTYATGTPGGARGTADVSWGPRGLPSVSVDSGYAELRVFDPVPAAFLRGTAQVTKGANGNPDEVDVDVTSLPSGKTLYSALNVAPSNDPVTVARRLQTDGETCINVTILDADTYTCKELAPNGVASVQTGDAVSSIVMGDPFALRNSVIEGLSSTLAELNRLDADNVDESTPLQYDQYSSTLPLVDLTPAQLAVERDALQQGLQAIDAAATADEQGSSDTPVSSAQELAQAVPQLVAVGSDKAYAPTLSFDLGPDKLGVQLTEIGKAHV